MTFSREGIIVRARITKLLATAMLIVLACNAEASHFRFGHLTWSPAVDAVDNTVDFKLIVGWRRSTFGGLGSGPGGALQTGDVFQAGMRLAFGDGSTTGDIFFEVIAYSALEDWVIVVGKQTRGGEVGIRKTYSSPLHPSGVPWVASLVGCCRILLRNEVSGWFIVKTTVDLTIKNTPPTTSMPPVATCPKGRVCSFTVPAVDAEGDNLRWSFSSPEDSSIFSLPGHPSALITIDETTGQITWDTPSILSRGFYAVQVRIADLDSVGNEKSHTVVDFLINLREFGSNRAPLFIEPTPSAGSTVLARVNEPLDLFVKAFDPDSYQSVWIGHAGLPPGASFNLQEGNPASGRISWLPSQPGEYVVTLLAVDSGSLPGTPYPIKIKVVDAQIRNVKVSVLVSTQDIELDSASFRVSPSRIENQGENTLVEWEYPTFAVGQVESLDFDVLFRKPVPGEHRVVTESITLSYEDVDGNLVQQKLDPQIAIVLPSVFDVSLNTDRLTYAANQTVAIVANIRNLADVDAVVDALVEIRDGAGNLVANVGQVPDIFLAHGASRPLEPLSWSTGSTYTGEYEVRLALLDQNGEVTAEAHAPFEIVLPGEVQASAEISTDKASYLAGDSVKVWQRTGNPAPNAQLTGATAMVVVRTPEGEILWQANETIPQLGPGSFHDRQYSVPLADSVPGVYEIVVEVFDSENRLLARHEGTFEVTSTALSGAGVMGALQLSAEPVFRTEHLNIHAELLNSGNADLAGLPVKLSIVDPANRQVVAEWTHTLAQLSVEDSATLQEEWFADAPLGATYAAVLAIEVGGHERILATRTFAIADKLPASLTLSGRGRLLALVDAEAPGTCKGVTELSVGFRPDLVLLPQDQVTVSLHGASGELLDAETMLAGELAEGVNTTPGSPVDLAVTGTTADRLALTLSAAENASFVNGSYRLTATHWQAGHPHVYDSGVFEVNCALEAGAAYGNFGIEEVLGADGADVHGPEGAPTRLAQRRFLQSMLDGAGWSYTLVHNAEDFARELRTDGYTVYALFNEQVKPPEALQQELAQAVAEGAGLLYAGYHDRRNGRLEPALGILSQGVLPRVHGLSLADSALHEDQQDFDFALDGRPLRATANGADELASYVPAGGLAIAEYRYGEGHSLYMGFDVLAEATAAGEESVPARLLSAALGRVHPASLAPVAGKVVPMSLRITNKGLPVSGQVLLAIPAGAQVVDGGSARLKVDGSLLWPFTLAQGETLTAPFWVRLPSLGGAAIFNGSIIVGVEQGGLMEYGPVSATLDVLVE